MYFSLLKKNPTFGGFLNHGQVFLSVRVKWNEILYWCLWSAQKTGSEWFKAALALVIWSSECRSAHWFTSLLVPQLTFWRRCNSNSVLMWSSLLSTSPKSHSRILLVRFCFLHTLCSWNRVYGQLRHCCKLLLQLILVLRTRRKKRNGLECVLLIYFSSVVWYVYGNFRCKNRCHEYKGRNCFTFKTNIDGLIKSSARYWIGQHEVLIFSRLRYAISFPSHDERTRRPVWKLAQLQRNRVILKAVGGGSLPPVRVLGAAQVICFGWGKKALSDSANFQCVFLIRVLFSERAVWKRISQDLRLFLKLALETCEDHQQMYEQEPSC